MFGFIGGIPTRLKHVFSKFKRFFTKPQYENFCRTQLGLITAGKKEHDIKSINELFIDQKDQSNVNRFMTAPKWSIEQVAKQGQALLLSESQADNSIEYKVIDDTVCRKYSSKTQMTCYNHSSLLGTVLSHDYVTGLYVNNSMAMPDGLKLYGNMKKCQEKKIEFKTRIQLASEIVDEHNPRAERTMMVWDSWYMCRELVSRCEARKYDWMGEIKSNRIAFIDDKRYHLHELLDELRSEGHFSDVVVEGELYSACQLDVFIPTIGHVCFVVNVKADTRDVHLLCTNLVGCDLEVLVGHALVMSKINKFHKDAKLLGFGEYRFRTSEAALIHAHLVVLACILLEILRRRLLRYGIVKGKLSIEETIEWVRKKAMHLFMHRVRESKLPMRSILSLINTN
jgi:DDE superfamily endonuclease